MGSSDLRFAFILQCKGLPAKPGLEVMGEEQSEGGEEQSEGGNAPRKGRWQRRGWGSGGQCTGLAHPSLWPGLPPSLEGGH